MISNLPRCRDLYRLGWIESSAERARQRSWYSRTYFLRDCLPSLTLLSETISTQISLRGTGRTQKMKLVLGLRLEVRKVSQMMEQSICEIFYYLQKMPWKVREYLQYRNLRALLRGIVFFKMYHSVETHSSSFDYFHFHPHSRGIRKGTVW